MKTIALVTGANKGIGLEICRQLAQKGFHVLLGSRDEARGQEAAASLAQDGGQVEAIVIDLAASATFENARKLIEERFGRLDVLINNAGVGEPEDFQGTAENVPIETLRRTFETNFFGLVDLTQRLLPLLRRSEHPRIVNQSSILASLTEHSDPNSVIADVHALAYDASKTAVNAFTVHLGQDPTRIPHQGELGPSRQREDGYESNGRSQRGGRRANRCDPRNRRGRRPKRWLLL